MEVSYMWTLMVSTDKVIRKTPTNITYESFNISYNPTLSLLNQSEETKLAIINLFTND
jgi:hypothetical protein